MLAAAVPSGFRGRLADFGAGAGAAGLAVAVALPGSARPCWSSARRKWPAFAAATLAHPGNAHLSDRASRARRRCHAGRPGARGRRARRRSLRLRHHEPALQRRRATARRRMRCERQAHVMEDGLFESWIRSAAAVVRPRGGLAVIARPEQLGADPRRACRPLRRCRDRCPSTRAPTPPRSASSCGRARGARGKLAHPPAARSCTTQPGNGFRDRAEMITNGLASLFGD